MRKRKEIWRGSKVGPVNKGGHVAQSCPTLCDPMDCSTPGFHVLHHLPEFAQTHVHWVNDAIQPSHPLSSPSPPAFNLSQHQGLFWWVGSSNQVPKYWSFSFSISPSIKYSGLISFRMDWFDLLAVQRILKSLLQHHSSKASILSDSAFLWSSSHICIRLLENHSFDYMDLYWQSDLCFWIHCLGWSQLFFQGARIF